MFFVNVKPIDLKSWEKINSSSTKRDVKKLLNRNKLQKSKRENDKV